MIKSKQDKCIVVCHTEEHTRQVAKIIFPKGYECSYHNYCIIGSNNFFYNSIPIKYSDFEKIYFSDWEKLPDSKSNFPEKWCIRIDEENLNYLNKYLHKNKDKYFGYNDGWKVKLPESGFEDSIDYFYSESKEPTHSTFRKRKGFTEITFDEFKEYILGQLCFKTKPVSELETIKIEPKSDNKFSQNKEIIGYKLVNKEYEGEALSIAIKNCVTKNWNSKESIDFHVNTKFYCNLKEAGVLHWFKPVYKEESIYQPLFNHLHEEYDLILLESQMQEIIDIVNSMQK